MRRLVLAALAAMPLAAQAGEGVPQDYSRSRQVQCLALAIYHEARGQSPAAQLAVAQVVRNRAASGVWPADACDVVFQRQGGRCQFSWVCTRARYRQPSDREAWREARRVAVAALSGAPDVTRGATHFHAASVDPQWHGLRRVMRLEGHVFYAQR